MSEAAKSRGSEALVAAICEIADEAKAERIETVDVRGKTTIADYFIVCSGNSDTHVRAIAGRIEDKMRTAKRRPLRVEGADTGWVLLDFGDVICHVMLESQRQFYDLESLWESMPKRPEYEA